MPYVHKFIEGEPFKSLHEIIEWLDQGGYVYWNDNVRHPAFMEHQSIAMFRMLINAHRGMRPCLRRAEPNPEYKGNRSYSTVTS